MEGCFQGERLVTKPAVTSLRGANRVSRTDVCSRQAENVSICVFVTAMLKNMFTYSLDDIEDDKLLSDWEVLTQN